MWSPAVGDDASLCLVLCLRWSFLVLNWVEMRTLQGSSVHFLEFVAADINAYEYHKVVVIFKWC